MTIRLEHGDDLAAMCLRLIVAGDIVQRDGEPVELLALLAIAEPRCRCERWRPGKCCRDPEIPEWREVA